MLNDVNMLGCRGYIIQDVGRFVVGQYVTVEDEVISHVNISHVRVEDGGQYACEASNSVGHVQHVAAVRVYGLPYVRHMSPVTAVAGRRLLLTCPAAGYPVANITWKKEGRTLPVSPRQKVYSNGTLVIDSMDRNRDGGRYTCAAARHGHQASRDVTVSVAVPPKLTPFFFPNAVLSEGNRASVTCQILEGDLPVTFRRTCSLPHCEGKRSNIPQLIGVGRST
ncbi:Immunoglobulin I-set [Trinorchestia longiramus]|nr:Immunoglobulin I-set [Trinorchestia longiramus]